MPRKVTADDITGILGMVPTPSLPGADHWSCRDSIDVESTTAMTAMALEAGIRILLTNGSLGEGATLTARDQKTFVSCMADVTRGRGLLFAGVTTLNTRDTIERARQLVDCGADGLFLGRPMWMSLDHAGIVRYYADLAEALPGVPFIVYDNQFAFKSKIATETYRALCANPSIVATKHIGGPSIRDDVRAVGERMRVLPLDVQWPALAREFPGAVPACWSGNTADGPEPLRWLAESVAARDWPRADHIAARMAWAQAPMFPDGRLEVFVEYNIPIAHARLEGSRLVRSGPPRPPYQICPEAYLAGGRETGRRWESLRRELQPGASGGAPGNAATTPIGSSVV